MTPTQFRALLWEQARRTGPLLAACTALGIFLPWLAEFSMTDELRLAMGFRPGESSPFTRFFAAAASIVAGLTLLFAYGSANNLAPTVPAYALRLPVKTLPLILTRFGYSVSAFAVSAGLIGSSLAALERGFEINALVDTWEWPAAATLAFLYAHAWGWCMGAVPHRLLHILCAVVIPLAILSQGIFYPDPWASRQVKILTVQTDTSGLLRAVIFTFVPAFTLLSFLAVERQRRGDSLLDMSGALSRFTRHETNGGPAFQSADEAQRWFERRQIGNTLLYAVLTIGLISTASATLLYLRNYRLGHSTDYHYYLKYELPIYWTPVLPAAAIFTAGLWFIRVFRWQWGSGSAFFFTRPMSSERLARCRVGAMMRAVVQTGAIALGIVVSLLLPLAAVKPDLLDTDPLVATLALAFGTWAIVWVSNLGAFAIVLVIFFVNEAFLHVFNMTDEQTLFGVFMLCGLFYAGLQLRLVGKKRIVRSLLTALTIILGISLGLWYGLTGWNSAFNEEFVLLIGLGLFCVAPMAATHYELTHARHR